MRTHSVFFLSLMLILNLSFFGHASALIKKTDFGGRLLDTKNLNTTFQLTCSSAYGAMILQPLGGAYSPIPYVIGSTSHRIHIGQQVLGKYSTNYTYCQNNSFGFPIPFPTFSITNFNVGK